MVPLAPALDTIMNVARFSKGVDLFIDLVGAQDAAPAPKPGPDFTAGVRSLQKAGHSLKDKERKTLLREARSRFHKAQNQEEGLLLARALLGLAVCHQHLGESLGAKNALETLIQIRDRPPRPDPVLDRKASHSPPDGKQSRPPDPAVAEIRSLEKFLMGEKARLGTADQNQEAVIDELERFAIRIKKKGVILFIKQLIAEKKKIQVATGKERSAIEELEKVVRGEADRLAARDRRRQVAFQEAKPEPDAGSAARRESGKLEELKQSVRDYLKDKAKLTYASEYGDWT